MHVSEDLIRCILKWGILFSSGNHFILTAS